MRRLLIYLGCAWIGGLAMGQDFIDPETEKGVMPENDLIGSEWELDFSDEFNADTLNTNKWTKNVSSKSRNPRKKIGVDDWWWKAENVWQEDGNLVLMVEKHDHNTMYCGSVNSKNKYETMYGYFETRIKVADASKGTHTAFWFHGQGMSNVDGTANDGAEIDVFESAWLGDYTKSVIHIDGYGKHHDANTKQYNTPGIHTGYHTWGFYWTENFMKIYYDGKLKVTYSGDRWIVRANEYLWLSDGASFGIEGDYFTSQPNDTLTHAYVDYIRSWKTTTDRLECEKLTASSPTSTAFKTDSVTLASKSAYVTFEAASVDEVIDFQVNAPSSGIYKLMLAGISSKENGVYGCQVKDTAGEWMDLTGVVDFYSEDSLVTQYSWSEIALQSGVNNIRFISKEKNALSGGYTGAFDYLKLERTGDIVVVEKPNSTKQVNENELKVFPNPVGDYLYVEQVNPENYRVRIYTIQGELIKEEEGKAEIVTSDLSPGLYVAVVGEQRKLFVKE